MKTMKNVVYLIGYMGSDAQCFPLKSGGKVCKASLATNDYYTDSAGQKQQRTQWHRLTGWGGIAERMERQLLKGSRVILEGKLNHRIYEDNNGVKRYLTEVHVNDFIVNINTELKAA